MTKRNFSEEKPLSVTMMDLKSDTYLVSCRSSCRIVLLIDLYCREKIPVAAGQQARLNNVFAHAVDVVVRHSIRAQVNHHQTGT